MHAPSAACPDHARRPSAARGLLLALSLVAVPISPVSPTATAADWPQFLGPNRDGSTSETAGNAWPNTGPRSVWTRDVGAGFGGPAVAGHRLVLHHRRTLEEIVECFDTAEFGHTLWRQAKPATYRDDFGFDEGPRATPCIAGDKVYTLGAAGLLACFDLASGTPKWTVDLAQKYGAGKGFFGFACSPLVANGRVLLNVGGRDGAGIMAFDAETGQPRWQATRHEAGYASPVLARVDGADRAVFFTREGLVVVDPASGAVRLERPWRSSQPASVNAATPLVLGNRVFLTASYGAGAGLLSLADAAAKPTWSGDQSLSSHYASVVHHQGYLYGFHGRQEQGPSLRCIQAETGTVQWSEDGFGAGTLLLAAQRLVILTERGELIVAPASPDGFRPVARGQAAGTGTRAYAALADHRLYVRDPRKLICLDLGSVR